jgi:carbon storage regulator
MLVITRKAGEGVMIGDEIEIRVNRIEGDFVKLAIRAPRELGIYRNEIYKQIKENNIAAVCKPDGEMPKLSLPRASARKDQV